MKYISNFQEFEAWITENSLVFWKVSSTTQAQDNNNKFVYDKSKEKEENMQLCQRALQRFAGQMLYATGWRTAEARTGGFSCIILYNEEAQPVTTPVQQPYIAGVTGAFDKETLIQEITQKVRNEYDTLNLKRERETLDAELKAFNEQKDGVMGLLVQYLAPVAKQMLGLRSTRVAGVDAAGVEAPAIKVQKTENEEEQEQESPFTDEQAEKLMQLMTRFAEVEPRYIELLEKVVELAEQGNKSYVGARDMLLG